MGFNEALGRALSDMRKYSAASVAKAAINAMQIGHLSRVDRVRSAPWLSALLLKWKLLNTAGPLNFGRDMPQAEFDRLRQMLWLANPARGFRCAGLQRDDHDARTDGRADGVPARGDFGVHAVAGPHCKAPS